MADNLSNHPFPKQLLGIVSGLKTTNTVFKPLPDTCYRIIITYIDVKRPRSFCNGKSVWYYCAFVSNFRNEFDGHGIPLPDVDKSPT